LIFTPYLFIPLPQGARKAGDMEKVEESVREGRIFIVQGAGCKPEWQFFQARTTG
jgi:hypothetical protein